MAITDRATASVKFDLKDETGSSSSVTVHIPGTTLVATAKTKAAALGALLAAITDCVVTGYSITYSAEETAVGVFAGAGSRVEHKGRLGFQRANGLNSSLEIPSIKPALVLSDGALDTSDTDLIAFVNGIVDDATFVGPDGSDIAFIYAAYEAFRGTTRRQLPSRKFIAP
jgi:hypothetical protein